MSSPYHPTSDIEDAFSSNFPDYIPTSPDCVPASLGKTLSESSNHSFGLVPIASSTLLLFHDDPYMKVMHAYYAKESPILPPMIVPPSSMLSPMFNPQEFFLPKDYFHLRNEDVTYHHPLLIPYLKNLRYEKALKMVLGLCLFGEVKELQTFPAIDDLPCDCGSQSKPLNLLENHGMPPKRTSTSAAPTMTQDAIRQFVADSVTATLEAKAATLANTDNLNRNTRPRETPVAKRGNYKEFISY
nr:hypothetical protein [Tanacetum cinerariifolium]